MIPKEHPVQGGFQQPVGQMIDPVGTSQCLSPAPQCLCCDPINGVAKKQGAYAWVRVWAHI